MSYTRHYDSALLDDLHNYFPELLYAPERFRSVADVLTYVQAQVRRRFDLFSRGRSEFLERDERTRIISTPPRAAGISMLFETHTRENINPAYSGASPNEFLQAINLLNGLFHGPTAPRQHTMNDPAFMEPVLVRPTAEQIQSGTAIEIVDSDEEICAICQDSLPAGTESLNLIACDHRFHSGCIRTWFTTHVACPVCRHDIREPAPSTE